MDNNTVKRITLFCGHYGSGKTNIAVNYALHLRKNGFPVSIADIDIVNPYFRTKDSLSELEDAGVEVIALPFANTSVDLPSMPSEVYGLVQSREKYVIMDIGGDDRGAYALGRFAPAIADENNYDMFFVANFYRPLTRTASEALEVLREIECASHLKFTGIVNNSNIGRETTAEDVLKTYAEAQELSRISGLPLRFTTAEEGIAQKLPEVFSLKLQSKIF
ncbi:MAG: hypothetical protein IKU65_02220 [Oscillospiraceae bacterium]|nr:hypothetical protein [Oscillospiraceae bacterium]